MGRRKWGGDQPQDEDDDDDGDDGDDGEATAPRRRQASRVIQSSDDEDEGHEDEDVAAFETVHTAIAEYSRFLRYARSRRLKTAHRTSPCARVGSGPSACPKWRGATG